MPDVFEFRPDGAIKDQVKFFEVIVEKVQERPSLRNKNCYSYGVQILP